MQQHSTPEVPDAHLQAWRALLNAHAAVVARIEAALAAEGLPPLTWYDVLWTLYRAPERRLRIGELADGLTISRSTFTRLADRLERAGLLRREAHPTDRRGQLVVLTPAGRRTLRRMWPVYARELEETVGKALEEEEARALARALTVVRDAAR
jgi:DNA-binding MarR family transcriptional regulator